MRTSKPRVLLLSDVRGWAFDQNFHDLETYLSDRFEFTHDYVRDWLCEGKPFPRMTDWDVVFAPYHRWPIEDKLPWDRTVGALRAQWLFPERKRPPEREEFEVVNRYKAFQVVTRANCAELQPHCPGVVYLTNPINMRRFPEPTKVRDRVVAEWNGNAAHSNVQDPDVKGFWSIVQTACGVADVPLEYAEFETRRKEPHEMPAFYQQANLALCASLYEGASSSVMEAMAAGLGVVATDCGNHREMHESMLSEYGDSGIMLVERSLDAFCEALFELRDKPRRVVEMGRINRLEIERAWSWSAWADRFAAFLRRPLGGEGEGFNV